VTRDERDAAVLEAVQSWRLRGQVGCPTPKGLALLVSLMAFEKGTARAPMSGRALSESLARLKARGQVVNGLLGWEAVEPQEQPR